MPVVDKKTISPGMGQVAFHTLHAVFHQAGFQSSSTAEIRFVKRSLLECVGPQQGDGCPACAAGFLPTLRQPNHADHEP